ncbi:MAG: helix-turn-helix transcriptional regulator [Coriobacteriales bacterium]|jgi:DNA-binding CsgD family transcriptional regulator|nr:helix-turn-helix transcriptional regulator [Coriobacteriales bacterium]
MVNIPKVSREKSLARLGTMIPGEKESLFRIVGFTCNRAWIYCVIFNPLLIASSGFTSIPLTVSLFCLAITLVVMALAHNLTKRLLEKNGCLMGAGMSMALGAFFWIMASTMQLDSVVLFVLCGILTGFGSSLMLMQWGRVFGAVPTATSHFESSLSYLSAACVFLMCGFLPLPASVGAAILLPLISVFILAQLKRLAVSPRPNLENLSAITQDSFFIKLLLGVLLIGTCAGVADEFYFIYNPVISPTDATLQFFLAALLAPLLMLIIPVFSKRLDFGLTYRPTLVVMIFGVLMLPFFTGGTQMTGWIVLAGYHCFDLMTWILLADLSYRFHISPILSFGLGRGVLYFSCGMGSCIGRLIRLYWGIGFESMATSLAVTVITLVLVLTYCLIFTEKDLSRYESVAKDGRPGAVMQSCSHIAGLYGLSPREEAVMRLLVKGRSIARIQTELFISKGTVNTHLRHIYQKLNIHTKQELLDLVEGDRLPVQAPEPDSHTE